MLWLVSLVLQDGPGQGGGEGGEGGGGKSIQVVRVVKGGEAAAAAAARASHGVPSTAEDDEEHSWASLPPSLAFS